MLDEFIATHRDRVMAKAREKVSSRGWPVVSTHELDRGIQMFLTQLIETLRWESTSTPFSPTDLAADARRHGGELLARGFSVSRVVHDYGAICQAATELALELHAPVTIDEFHVLNRCLDLAIAEAVTEHARITAESRSSEELERVGRMAHEIRNRLNPALIAFDIIKSGTVSVNGSTGAVISRSLLAISELVDSTLGEIRTAASHHRAEVISMTPFIHDIAVVARLQGERAGLQFVVGSIEPDLFANVDRQLLESALMNLVNNGFNYTRPGGAVTVRACRHGETVHITVQDQCGGIADATGDPFQAFGERRGRDRSGLGLGLSIARRAIRAEGGEINVRNMPGEGCVFTIEVPLSGAPVPGAMLVE